MKNVVTHSRSFNLDEVVAIALLDIFLLKDGYKLIRTRDEKLLKEHQNNKNSYVIDVGFVYDKEALNFDHHQKYMNKKWDDNTPFSACGLIWEHLKDLNVLDLDLRTIQKFESIFIKKVDKQDNGMGTFTEMSFVTLSNRNLNDNVIDNKFKKVLLEVKSIIKVILDNIQNKKTNIFCHNMKVNKFLDNLIAPVLIHKLAFVNDFVYEIKDDYAIFNFTNAKKAKSRIFMDFSNNSFCIDGELHEVKGYMTVFVWDFLKKNNYLSQKMNSDVIGEIEGKLIDNFRNDSIYKEVSYLQMFNGTKHSVLPSVFSFVSNLFYHIKVDISANKELVKSINKSKDLDQIIFLSKNIKSVGQKIAKLSDDAKLFIFPRDKSSWMIQVVPEVNNLSKSRISMPEKWLGLKDKDLINKSGEKGMVFCHKGGYMCIVKGDKNHAVDVASKIIKGVY